MLMPHAFPIGLLKKKLKDVPNCLYVALRCLLQFLIYPTIHPATSEIDGPGIIRILMDKNIMRLAIPPHNPNFVQ